MFDEKWVCFRQRLKFIQFSGCEFSLVNGAIKKFISGLLKAKVEIKMCSVREK